MGTIQTLEDLFDILPKKKEEPIAPWTKNLNFFIPMVDTKTGEELFNEQIGQLGSALLVDDYDSHVEVDTAHATFGLPFKFPDGALLSGSFIMHFVSKHVGNVDHQWDDMDIYFKCKADAQKFVTDNALYGFSTFESPMCSYGYHEGVKLNLIYGVEYNSPEHLIKRYDIRACSMALDPNSSVLYCVRGSIQDATRKRLVFNPVPRGCSMRRYAKYIKKGFECDSHQNLFFAELIKSDIYKPELELVTKEY